MRINDILTIIFSSISVIFSVIGLIIAIKSWYKTRVYYDLDVYHIVSTVYGSQLKLIKDKLNSGKYTIVDSFSETYPNGKNTIYVILGKIKK